MEKSMKKWMIAAGGVAAVAAICQIAYGIYHWKHKSAMAISIIGGADGPTSVFLAGKVPAGLHLGTAICGAVVLLAVIVAFFIWRRHK